MSAVPPQSTYVPNAGMLEVFREVVRQGRLPSVLYKYWSAEGVKRFLRTGQILFNHYMAFNDPFDCSAAVDTRNTFEEWYKFLLSQGVSSVKAATLASRCVKEPTTGENVIRDNIEKVKSSNGIFCTTTHPDNLLMWAHYAQDHTGACVGFDVAEDMETFCPTQKVEYSDDYLRYNYLRDQGKALTTIFRKSTAWSYEDEYRTLHIEGYGLMSVRPEAVKEIILGCRISPKDKQEICDILRASSYPNAQIKFARKSQVRYELEIG